MSSSVSSTLLVALVVVASSSAYCLAAQCGRDAGGAPCPDGLCCSNYGYCGSTDSYCAPGNCQSQCPIPSPPPPPPPPPPPAPAPPPGEDITDVIDSALFDEILLHRNDNACPGKGFYTFDAFVAAARTFPNFAVTGNSTMRKTEVAAFLAQTSHETTGGWSTAPDGAYAWGYCYISEVGSPSDYCIPREEWPCFPGKKYYGRGPIQLSYNYNYGQAGEALGLDLLENPDLVENDPVVAFRTAIWFWMTEQLPKPSCHDVILGKWIPSAADQAAGRVPGYGVTTNIINGGLECGFGPDLRVISRIGFYERYCKIFGVNPGDNLDCFTQQPFGRGLKLSNAI